MARILDLNSVQSSLMDLTLQDDAHTVLHLDIPTEGMVNELQNNIPELQKIKTGDRSNVDVLYDIAARILSCNQDYIKITPEELPTKYKMNLVVLTTFFSEYLGAINDLAAAKN